MIGDTSDLDHFMASQALTICILAAGKGSRLRSSTPKVLHAVAGRSTLARVVEAACALNPSQIIVVGGESMDALQSALAQETFTHPITWVRQAEPQGTGDAVACALPVASESGRLLVLYGDVPLVDVEGLEALLQETPNDALGLLSMMPDRPDGFGRLMRDAQGSVLGIVEHTDATAAQREIREVFTGILCAPIDQLKACLAQVNNDNAQGEYYLPDVLPLSLAQGMSVSAFCVPDANRFQGVNTQAELARAERQAQHLIAETLMKAGVCLKDPQRLDVRGKLICGSDVVIEPNVLIEGSVHLGDRVHIGPNVTLKNTSILDDVQIKSNCVIDGADIGAESQVGPFAYLRPGTVLAKNSKAGTFVELKNTQLGAGSKAAHLSYLGDAQIGQGVNIGAGVITCNYDGQAKHQTVIADGAFIGADSQLVAPIQIGKNATIGAGSCITKPVEAESLAVTRTAQKSVQNWPRPGRKED